jgi:hypothetical protein
MRFPRFLPLALILLAAACASGSPGTERPASQRREVITSQQLNAIPGNTAQEAVRRFRPRWLSNAIRPFLFLDGRQHGDGSLSLLNRFRVETIWEIEYVPGPEAAERFGSRYGRGVINIITR